MEADNKFCPMLRGNCRGKECAWWVERQDCCALAAITWELSYRLEEIRDAL